MDRNTKGSHPIPLMTIGDDMLIKNPLKRGAIKIIL